LQSQNITRRKYFITKLNFRLILLFNLWFNTSSTQHSPAEAAMKQTTHPSKEAVRQFMARRQAERTPPPSPERIRQELGWHLIEAERRLVR
jgi:hypothetical protein